MLCVAEAKMTHHFIHGHPSRKQTVTLYLKDSIIAVQDFREKRKYSVKVRKTFYIKVLQKKMLQNF